MANNPLMIKVEASKLLAWGKTLEDMATEPPQASVFLPREQAMEAALRQLQSRCSELSAAISAVFSVGDEACQT